VRIFRHQPLLIWTLVLLLLAGVAVVGATTDREQPLRATPTQIVDGDHETLLTQSSSLMAAVGAGDVQAWAAETGPTIAAGLDASEGTDLESAWGNVDMRYKELLAASDTGDKTRIISAVSAYNNAVSALVRQARQ